MNHKIPYDSVIKRHLRPIYKEMQRARSNTPIISPLSGVPEITYDAVI